jgi:plastocyanin
VLRHNVAVQSGPSKFRSRTQVSGTFSHTFTKAGTYHLYCTLHRYMKMTIVVK